MPWGYAGAFLAATMPGLRSNFVVNPVKISVYKEIYGLYNGLTSTGGRS